MMNRYAWGQATASMQAIASGAKPKRKKKRSSGKRTVARMAKKKRGARVSASKIAKRRPPKGRLKKGSAAAKAWMAKIRKKRR